MGHFGAHLDARLFAATLHALIPPFLIILIGQGLKAARVLHISHVPVMNGIVMNVAMPSLILVQLAGGPKPTLHSFLPPACLIVTEFILIGAAILAGRLARLDDRRIGTTILASTFGNTGYLGYPICLALLPRQFPAAVLMDQFAMGIPMYVIAAFIGARYGNAAAATSPNAAMAKAQAPLADPAEKELHPAAAPNTAQQSRSAEPTAAQQSRSAEPISPQLPRSSGPIAARQSQSTAVTIREPITEGAASPAPHASAPAPSAAWRPAIIRFLKSPLFIALTTGLALRVIPWPAAFLNEPTVKYTLEVAAKSFSTVGQATIPLVLLALGVTLRPGSPGRIAPFAICFVLKLFGSPLIFWALARAVGIRGELLAAAVLMAAMPTAAMSAVLSSQYEMDADMAVGIVFLSTTLSAITVPLMLSILR